MDDVVDPALALSDADDAGFEAADDDANVGDDDGEASPVVRIDVVGRRMCTSVVSYLLQALCFLGCLHFKLEHRGHGTALKCISAVHRC